MRIRLLFIGDVVGKPGRRMVVEHVPRLIDRHNLDLVIANGENAAGGSGLTPPIFRRLTDAGVDVITMGDHVFRNNQIMSLWRQSDRLLRPCNLPEDAPGAECTIVTSRSGVEVAATVALGRVFMKPIDCPFRAVDRVLDRLESRVKCIVVDMHAEATSDKQIMGRYMDGRVSAVVGTHTHVPTADETILPGGTAYITDVGMTGPYHSILGRRIDRVVPATIAMVPQPFGVATEDPRLAAVLIELDAETGKATGIERIMVRGEGRAESGVADAE
jgi:metallophosphoesterase (TIGR00282 family)